MLTDKTIGELVNKYSLEYDLRPDIVACIIIQESAGDTFATRWEDKFYYNHLASKKSHELAGWIPSSNSVPTIATERMQRSCSYGLMQVLGDTARWCGKVVSPYLTILCDPDRGVDVGCRVLSFYLGRAKGDYRAALKGYNGAWSYADKVLLRVARNEHKRFFIGD